MVQKIEKTVLCQQINDHNIENVNKSGEVYISNTATRYNYHRTRSHCLIELHQQSTKGFNIFARSGTSALVAAAKNKRRQVDRNEFQYVCKAGIQYRDGHTD